MVGLGDWRRGRQESGRLKAGEVSIEGQRRRLGVAETLASPSGGGDETDAWVGYAGDLDGGGGEMAGGARAVLQEDDRLGFGKHTGAWSCW